MIMAMMLIITYNFADLREETKLHMYKSRITDKESLCEKVILSLLVTRIKYHCTHGMLTSNP